ncbi:MAG TPA: PIG-L family deacetylase [Gemmatimonadales bacterium]
MPRLSDRTGRDYLSAVCRLPALLALPLFAAFAPLALEAQLQPPSTGGYAALDHALRKLGHHKRALMIAAHPDDEDTELLTVLVRGMGAEAAYLSLNRGEGGQNLIGEELGEALGLLRTEELLAARRLDGATQFFTRTYDFGFSKNLDDTWAHWPRDSVLKDVVRIIRRFRPQIVVSIFSGTPRDGHGQHQAAGWAAKEAFRVAGDPAVFPELLTEEGLVPFTPLKLYRSTRFDSAATTLTLDGGALDPAVGQSYHQIAMRGRSLHRSQDMGQLQRIGPSRVRLQLLEDRTGQGGAGLWSGLDTTLTGVPGIAALSPVPRREVAALLDRYVARVDSARGLVAGSLRGHLRELLRAASTDLAAARSRIRDDLPAETRRAAADGAVGDPGLDAEYRRLGEAWVHSLDLVADGVSDDVRVVPGERLGVNASVWNAGDQAADATLCAAAGQLSWRLVSDSNPPVDVPRTPARGACLGYLATTGAWSPLGTTHDPIAPGRVASARLEVTVPEEQDYSTPYFLRRPRLGELYQWDPDFRSAWGLPFEEALLRLVLRSGELEDPPVEIAFRGNDQASGEFRRPVVVVPRVDVRLDPEQELWPRAARTSHRFTVTLTHGGRTPASGRVALRLPQGWAQPAPQEFRFTENGARASFSFSVRPPAGVTAGSFEVTALAVDEHGRGYDIGIRTVDHPHIRPRTWTRRAAATVRIADIVLPRLRRLAYVRGAADRVPEALENAGLPTEVIPATALIGNLTRYDAIVIGPRAFETDPDLSANNERLVAYVRAGGTVIVQYQQYGYFLGDYAPFPLTVGVRAPGAPNSDVTTARRPGQTGTPALLGGHDRVTDETAPVVLVDPASPTLRYPNRIGPSDWQGWVQERGLYFAHSWDPAWRPVLAMHDPGEPPLEGGLLVARVGKGSYVYTGLSFFRQLPAGVAGAWRLFANMLALGHPQGASGRRPAAPRDSIKVERE